MAEEVGEGDIAGRLVEVDSSSGEGLDVGVKVEVGFWLGGEVSVGVKAIVDSWLGEEMGVAMIARFGSGAHDEHNRMVDPTIKIYKVISALKICFVMIPSYIFLLDSRDI